MAKIGLLVCGRVPPQLADKYPNVNYDFFVKTLMSWEASLDFKMYDAFDGDLPSSYDECDGWMLTGSSHGAYEELPWMLHVEEIIRTAYRHNKPVAGVCFGHQLMAKALGGRVIKVDAGWGIGFQQYDLQEPLGAVTGNSLDLFAIHQDQVVELPPQARVSAGNDHCPNAALNYEGSALSFQAHPEFSAQFEQDLLQSLDGTKLESSQVKEAVEEMQGVSVHNSEIMAYIAHFLATGQK